MGIAQFFSVFGISNYFLFKERKEKQAVMASTVPAVLVVPCLHLFGCLWVPLPPLTPSLLVFPTAVFGLLLLSCAKFSPYDLIYFYAGNSSFG